MYDAGYDAKETAGVFMMLNRDACPMMLDQ